MHEILSAIWSRGTSRTPFPQVRTGVKGRLCYMIRHMQLKHSDFPSAYTAAITCIMKLRYLSRSNASQLNNCNSSPVNTERYFKKLNSAIFAYKTNLLLYVDNDQLMSIS